MPDGESIDNVGLPIDIIVSVIGNIAENAEIFQNKKSVVSLYEDCFICLDGDIENDGQLFCCGKRVHKKCITRWLRTKQWRSVKCPNCQKTLSCDFYKELRAYMTLSQLYGGVMIDIHDRPNVTSIDRVTYVIKIACWVTGCICCFLLGGVILILITRQAR